MCSCSPISLVFFRLFVEFVELPGCLATGETEAEALEELARCDPFLDR